MKTVILAALIPVGLSLSACSDMDETPIAQMSCTDLARDIGRHTERRNMGDAEAVFGTLGAALSKSKEDKLIHGVEGAIGGISSSLSRDRLDKLQAAYAKLGCR